MHYVEYVNDDRSYCHASEKVDFMRKVSKGLLLPILGINSCLKPDKMYKKWFLIFSYIYIYIERNIKYIICTVIVNYAGYKIHSCNINVQEK